MKKLNLLVISLLLLVNITFSAEIPNRVSLLDLPLIEHACYTKFIKPETIYNFNIQPGNKINNNLNPENKSTIIINKAQDMCDYSSDRNKCLECIVLKRYGINETNKSPEIINKKINNSTLVLIMVIAVLLLILFYTIISKIFKKDKIYKENKNNKLNGKSGKSRKG